MGRRLGGRMRISLPAWKPVAAVAAAGALSLALLGPVAAQTNQAPTPQADAATTAEDTAVVIAVLTNDTDLEGTTLTLSSVGTLAHGPTELSTIGTASCRERVRKYV